MRNRELDTKMEDFQGIIELTEAFDTEQKCRDYFAQKRWDGKPKCPHCGHDKKIYECKSRGLYKCSDCSKQFTVKVGTIMEGSNLSLRKWFMAIYLITSHTKGISSMQLGKDLHITQKSAWHLLHRIRFALRTRSLFVRYSGTVEADETIIGGLEKNKHADKRIPHAQGRSSKGKTVVFGLLERGGEVRAQTVSNSAMESLHPVIIENVSQEAILMTDEWRGYNQLDRLYEHYRVNHSHGEYVLGDAHTNTIEGFWSMVKRSLIGVYHMWSPKHMDKYLDAAEYRYNTRKLTDKGRFDKVLGMSEGRLSYKDLIKKAV